jgi:hypothetical protein
MQVVVAVLPLFEQDGMDVTLKVIDGDEGLVDGKADGFRETQSDEEGAREPWTLGDGDGVYGFIRSVSLFQRRTNHRNTIAQMFARGEFGHNAFVGLVRGELRENDVGDDLFAGTNDGGGGFVARALDAEDVGHD